MLDLLLGHHLARAVVHLGVVDADAAEDGERLEQAHVRLVELLLTLLERDEGRSVEAHAVISVLTRRTVQPSTRMVAYPGALPAWHPLSSFVQGRRCHLVPFLMTRGGQRRRVLHFCLFVLRWPGRRTGRQTGARTKSQILKK